MANEETSTPKYSLTHSPQSPTYSSMAERLWIARTEQQGITTKTSPWIHRSLIYLGLEEKLKRLNVAKRLYSYRKSLVGVLCLGVGTASYLLV